jgi:hypothetical protein
MSDEVFNDFNLVGGTALSLKLGHRRSIDIDLFTNKDFDAKSIKLHLEDHYNVEKVQTLKNGVFGLVSNIKVDLLAHQYPAIKPIEVVEGIRMLSLDDIGAMKLYAIIQNGTRLKDFIDVHFLLEHRSFSKLTDALMSKYPEVNKPMASAALLYHNDIDFTIPIKLIKGEVQWNKIEERLREAVTNNNKIFQHQAQRINMRQQQKPTEKLKQRKPKQGPKL